MPGTNLIHRFDAFLRHACGVFEFSDDPACLFRIAVKPVAHGVSLPGLELPAGSRIIELHFWNEHTEPIPPEGPDLGWALRVQRRLVASLRLLARAMAADPRLAGARAVGGATAHFYAGEGSGGEKLFQRLGFTLIPYRSPLGRFGEFWENFYTWAIMWAYNRASLRGRNLFRLRRCEMWMPIAEFLRRYGN